MAGDDAICAPREDCAACDLAAGTGVVGYVAAALVGSGGRVIVTDLSSAMIEVAKRRAAEAVDGLVAGGGTC